MVNELIITFDEISGNPAIGDTISIQTEFNENITVTPFTFQSSRTAPNTVGIGATSFDTMLLFTQALVIDFAIFNLDIEGNYTVIANPDDHHIRISSPDNSYHFVNFGYTGSANITDVINSSVEIPKFTITGVNLTGSLTPCATINVNIEQEDGTPDYMWVSPLNGTIGLTGELSRSGLTTLITIEDDLGDQDSISVFVPEPLTLSDILNITQVPEISGLSNAVTITMSQLQGIAYQFSLDATNFSTSNVFTGLGDGTYTLTVIDQYGCSIEQEFEVIVIGIVLPPYAEIPKSNSIMYVRDQQEPNGLNLHYQGDNVQPNDYDVIRFNNPDYCQLWSQVDTDVRTQFKTSYESISVILLDSDFMLEDTYDINKISTNISGQALQTNITNLGNGESAVWFSSGVNDEYDPNTGLVIGSHPYDRNLPSWAEVGRLIFISGTVQEPTSTTYEIKQIVNNHPLVNADVMVITRVHQSANDTIIGRVDVDSAASNLNYEVYEPIHNFSAIPNGTYYVAIVLTDPNHTSILFLSNPLNIGGGVYDAKLQDHVYAEYSGHDSDGIDYGTGIVHKQRFQGIKFFRDYAIDAAVHTNSNSSDTKLYGIPMEMWTVDAINVPIWMYEKLNLLATKNFIKIDGVEVQNNEGWEVEFYDKYQRCSIVAKFKNNNYEQHFSDTFDIDGKNAKLLTNDGGFLEL